MSLWNQLFYCYIDKSIRLNEVQVQMLPSINIDQLRMNINVYFYYWTKFIIDYTCIYQCVENSIQNEFSNLFCLLWPYVIIMTSFPEFEWQITNRLILRKKVPDSRYVNITFLVVICNFFQFVMFLHQIFQNKIYMNFHHNCKARVINKYINIS